MFITIQDNIVIDNGNQGNEENQRQEINEKEFKKPDEDQEHETHKKKENQLQSISSSKKVNIGDGDLPNFLRYSSKQLS